MHYGVVRDHKGVLYQEDLHIIRQIRIKLIFIYEPQKTTIIESSLDISFVFYGRV